MPRQAPVRKNQTVRLDITALTSEGSGVGRAEGFAVFVPFTAPGDTVDVRIVQVRPSYAYGIVEEMAHPSADRIENDCPAYGRCGGCALRHLAYPAELEAKSGWVAENLRRIGGVELPLEPILPSPTTERYRNKAQYPIRLVDGRVRAGFFAPRSHRLVSVEDCRLQPEGFREIVETVTGFLEEFSIPPYEEASHEGLARHLFIRQGGRSGEAMVWLALNGDELPHWEELLRRLREACPSLASFGIDRNRKRQNTILEGELRLLWGRDAIRDTLCGVPMELSPLSFYQVNHGAAELLFRTALEFADPSPEDVLLDLYCGAGVIGLSMAHRVGRLIGVEAVTQAVDNARKNAAACGAGNAEFLCADASEAAARLEGEGLRPDIVILDPPRKGASEETLRAIVRMAPRKLVYISCNSATLARDVKLLGQSGYVPRRIRPADFFPRTANVECCCLLEREML